MCRVEGLRTCMFARPHFCVIKVNYVFLGYLPTPFHVYQMRWKDTTGDD